jgi:AraC-like DNA-binding protein/quercetin dioxygenase-like cupin family protein
MQLSTRAEFELVPRSALQSFAVREFHLPAFASPWHYHPECELTYIFQGSGKRFVGDSILPFGPGDLVLLGSNLPHYWRNEAPGETREEFAHSLVIQFREECFGVEFLSRPELDQVRKLLLHARRGLVFSGETAHAVAQIMGGMQEANGLSRLINLLTIFRLLVEAREVLVLSSPGFSPQLDELASERINRAYQHVFDNFTATLDRQAIAHAAGMSLSAFCHYFKRVTGRTLSDFINEVRIGHAKKLLIDTDRTISEVAYASGYESLSNFNRCFYSLTRLSPTQYRAQHQPV